LTFFLLTSHWAGTGIVMVVFSSQIEAVFGEIGHTNRVHPGGLLAGHRRRLAGLAPLRHQGPWQFFGD
jgi:hypothetical protein